MIWEYGIHTGKDNVKVRAENLFFKNILRSPGKDGPGLTINFDAKEETKQG
jgi:hypothetical protein